MWSRIKNLCSSSRQKEHGSVTHQAPLHWGLRMRLDVGLRMRLDVGLRMRLHVGSKNDTACGSKNEAACGSGNETVPLGRKQKKSGNSLPLPPHSDQWRCHRPTCRRSCRSLHQTLLWRGGPPTERGSK